MPGTVAFVEAGDDDRFSRCFLASSASITGQQYCKPVIELDGCFIKNQYLGTILVAATIDANGQTFPLAFGVVDTENTATWSWVLDHLRNIFVISCTSIISDRQKGLINAVEAVLPGCPHAFCVKHLADNATGKGSKKARPFIFRLAKVKNLNDYNDILKEMAIVSQTAAEYIEKTADPQHWVECIFPGNRWGHTTSNVVESLNAAINEAREQPIVQMFDSIRAMLGRWFVSRRKEARAMIEFPLVPRAVKNLEERLMLLRDLRSIEVDDDEFEVIDSGRVFNVDIEEKSCSCCDGKEGIPCAHLLMFLTRNGSRGIEYCAPQHSSLWYLRAYEGRILSVDDVTLESNVESDERAPEVNVSGPPIAKPRVGRPKKVRMRNAREKKSGSKPRRSQTSLEPAQKRIYKCGLCGEVNHNKRGCPNQ
ncbi:hypothetical protein P9112_012656 [Eukaryota sp. TZLM1-RC]